VVPYKTSLSFALTVSINDFDLKRSSQLLVDLTLTCKVVLLQGRNQLKFSGGGQNGCNLMLYLTTSNQFGTPAGRRIFWEGPKFLNCVQ